MLRRMSFAQKKTYWRFCNLRIACMTPVEIFTIVVKRLAFVSGFVNYSYRVNNLLLIIRS